MARMSICGSPSPDLVRGAPELILGNTRFRNLLNKVHYDPEVDRLVVAGDLTTKGPLDGSLAILADFARLNVTAVRGNHDQKVVQWRGWIENVLSKKKGPAWLEKQERKEQEDEDDEDEDLQIFKKKWKRIPEDWNFYDKHYKVARSVPHSSWSSFSFSHRR
jgi:DNA segregation ATPase FtsK/SpoIIIE-like protein